MGMGKWISLMALPDTAGAAVRKAKRTCLKQQLGCCHVRWSRSGNGDDGRGERPRAPLPVLASRRFSFVDDVLGTVAAFSRRALAEGSGRGCSWTYRSFCGHYWTWKEDAEQVEVRSDRPWFPDLG